VPGDVHGTGVPSPDALGIGPLPDPVREPGERPRAHALAAWREDGVDGYGARQTAWPRRDVR
jgi:hypothetical protein